jgi:CBS domain-containing protein
MRVEDVMTRDVAAVGPGTSLKQVARELVRRRVSGMPVVDDHGRVVGVVSEADVLVKERGDSDQGGALARLLHGVDHAQELKLDARTAGEAMTSPAITIEGFWSVATAAQLMLDRAVNRLPVVQRGRLVGIVTRADLVRAFARSDDDVAQEIREQLALQEALWLDSGVVEVRVDAGETTLAGEVRRRSEAEVLPRIVATVPGVIGVHSQLTWSEDG